MIHLVIGLEYVFRVNEGNGRKPGAKLGFGRYIGNYRGTDERQKHYLFEVIELNPEYGIEIEKLVNVKQKPIGKCLLSYYKQNIPLNTLIFSRRKTEILDYYNKRDKLRLTVINAYK